MRSLPLCQTVLPKLTATNAILNKNVEFHLQNITVVLLQIWCYPDGVQEAVDTLKSRVTLTSCMRSFDSVFPNYCLASEITAYSMYL